MGAYQDSPNSSFVHRGSSDDEVVALGIVVGLAMVMAMLAGAGILIAIIAVVS